MMPQSPSILAARHSFCGVRRSACRTRAQCARRAVRRVAAAPDLSNSRRGDGTSEEETMKRLLTWSLGLTLFLVAAVATTSRAQTYTIDPGRQIDVTYFYDNLSNDGEWFHDANYGWCW